MCMKAHSQMKILCIINGSGHCRLSIFPDADGPMLTPDQAIPRYTPQPGRQQKHSPYLYFHTGSNPQLVTKPLALTVLQKTPK